jgi:hypothetical protein
MRGLDVLLAVWLALAVALIVLAVLFLRVADDAAAGTCASLALALVLACAVVGSVS